MSAVVFILVMFTVLTVSQLLTVTHTDKIFDEDLAWNETSAKNYPRTPSDAVAEDKVSML